MRLRIPLHDLWWLISRAAGVTAIVLITVAVVLGLAMASRSLRSPRNRRLAMRLHEDIALVALAAIAVHGLALLGDAWLKPGLAGIAIPFVISYRPALTGLGIIGGYVTMLLALSFYLRRVIGARRWRKLHRLMLGAWALAAIHAIGTGTDGGSLWLRAIVLAPAPLIAYLLVARLLGGRSAASRATAASAGGSAASRATAAAPGDGVGGRAGAPAALRVRSVHDGAEGRRRPAGRRRIAGQLEPEGGSGAG